MMAPIPATRSMSEWHRLVCDQTVGEAQVQRLASAMEQTELASDANAAVSSEEFRPCKAGAAAAAGFLNDDIGASPCMEMESVTYLENATGSASEAGEMCRNEGCKTPKSKACRIPEILQCPPAPRKRRAIAQKRYIPPTSFFIIQDFELFFPHEKLRA